MDTSLGDTEEIEVEQGPSARPQYAMTSSVLTVSLQKLHERQLINNSTEQFIRIVKNPNCSIDERMLEVKQIKLTRGALSTLVDSAKPFHRKIIDAYFAVLQKINKENLLMH
jgi:hypothetical protein